ncbi:MAG: hypothetical protein ACPG4T_18535, partial [Nannocystaceae bacterium]
FAGEQRLRVSVLNELNTRITRAEGNLNEAKRILETEKIDLSMDFLGGRQDLANLLLETVDMRPLTTREMDLDRVTRLQRAAHALDLVGGRIVPETGSNNLVLEIDSQLESFERYKKHIDLLLARDAGAAVATDYANRQALWAQLFNDDPYGEGGKLAGWVLDAGGESTVSSDIARLAQSDPEALSKAVFDPAAAIWHGGLTDSFVTETPIEKPSVRYRSPVEDATRHGLFGSILLGLAALMLVVVGPVITATHTAREREAGTLPVLRMTGLSAGDLALAMSFGSNVFSLMSGGLLLLLGLLFLATTVGIAPLLLPLLLLTLLTGATHATAIGMGDSLGQRVNALVVGAMVAVMIVGPGLFGAALVGWDISSTGLLLGPLPVILGGISELTGLPGTSGLMTGGTAELGSVMFAYTIGFQLLTAGICLMSWRRRVDQSWAPLFRPAEGMALALASIGCSALTLYDISERINTQSFDGLNAVTFLASIFLLPVLAWLLVSSLRLPARASAVATHVETRAAFLRFQGFLIASTVAVGFAYATVMQRAGLSGENSEIMWATLTQVLLIAETAVATLLLAARRREGKHRVAMLGVAAMVLQTALAVGVYRMEVDFVALTQSAGSPFLYGMEASPYWIAFMIFMWGTGLGLVIAALLRERDRAQAEAEAEAELDEYEQEEGQNDGRGRWLH